MPVATDPRSPNGTRSPSQPQRLAVEPPASGRRQRLPELAVGVLLVVGCALAALMLAAGDRDRSPVIALSGDVARGQVLTDADLSTVYIESDSAIATTPSADRDRLVGRAALSDLPSGTLVIGEQLGDPVEVLDAGEGTVGLALEAGQLPSLTLAPGDEVSVVAAGDPTSSREAGEVVRRGVVVAVDEQTAGGSPSVPRRQKRTTSAQSSPGALACSLSSSAEGSSPRWP